MCKFHPEHVIWFDDIPRANIWQLDPNKERRETYVDERGNTVPHPYTNDGRPMSNAEYYEYVWTRGLPIGNGRLGAMVFGAVDKEIIQLNESSVWTGAPYMDESGTPTSGSTKDAWQAYRGMNSDGTPAEIGTHPDSISYKALRIDNSLTKEAIEHRFRLAREVEEKFLGTPMRQHSYQSFVELHIDFGHDPSKVSDYTRSLDLREAIATVEYVYEGVHYVRESFASYPDQAVVTNITVSQAGQLSMQAELHTYHTADAVWRQISEHQIALHSKVKEDRNAIQFEARLIVDVLGGEMLVSDDCRSISVKGADQVTLSVVGATNYVNYVQLDNLKPARDCDEAAAALQKKTFQAIKAAHIADHQALYERTSLTLLTETDCDTKMAAIPTDLRVRPEGFGTGTDQLAGSTYARHGDLALPVLLFHYGKYLLIAGSRPGGQPLTLQGLWNATNSPAWNSKYTININTEMNYWPAQILNLGECEQPLFATFDDLVESGKITAREHYAIEGNNAWVMHHNFDLWRGTQPIDNATAGLWPTGGVWLLIHAWQSYEFSRDRDLVTRIYPHMKGAAAFFTQFLVEDPRTGYLITAASVSPEHGGIQPGPAMDTQLIRMLYEATLQAAALLGEEEAERDLLDEIAQQLPRIAPNLIDEDGYIREWARGDVTFELRRDLSDNPEYMFTDPTTGEKSGIMTYTASNTSSHRHVSHLWEVYPGTSLCRYEENPERKRIMEAFQRTVVAKGRGTGQGWALAWRINLRARIADSEGADAILKQLLDTRISPNLFDQHPPFQIDGNFGATAGIAEMLIQSHDGAITLLPALPERWKSGEFKGFKARGDVTVDIIWSTGIPQEVKIYSGAGGLIKVRNPHSSTAVVINDSHEVIPVTREENDTMLVFLAEERTIYTLKNFT